MTLEHKIWLYAEKLLYRFLFPNQRIPFKFKRKDCLGNKLLNNNNRYYRFVQGVVERQLVHDKK